MGEGSTVGPVGDMDALGAFDLLKLDLPFLSVCAPEGGDYFKAYKSTQFLATDLGIVKNHCGTIRIDDVGLELLGI